MLAFLLTHFLFFLFFLFLVLLEFLPQPELGAHDFREELGFAQQVSRHRLVRSLPVQLALVERLVLHQEGGLGRSHLHLLLPALLPQVLLLIEATRRADRTVAAHGLSGCGQGRESGGEGRGEVQGLAALGQPQFGRTARLRLRGAGLVRGREEVL